MTFESFIEDIEKLYYIFSGWFSLMTEELWNKIVKVYFYLLHFSFSRLPDLRKVHNPTQNDLNLKQLEYEALVKLLKAEFENDDKAMIAFEYFERSIFAGLDQNDYDVYDQLIRLFKAADSCKELLCELEKTGTTMSMHRRILLINGKLNIDGAAFSLHTNHGTLMKREELLKGIMNDDLKVLKVVQKKYKWTLEGEVTEFKKFLKDNSITLNGIIDTLTITHYNRLIQVYNNNNKSANMWKAAEIVGRHLDCDNAHMYAGIIERINYKLNCDCDNEMTTGNTKKKQKYKNGALKSLTDDLQKETWSEDTKNFVNDIKIKTDEYCLRYEQKDSTLQRFNEHAEAEGFRAAAFELVSHALKRFREKENYRDLDEKIWIEEYSNQTDRVPTSLYTQDGRMMKTVFSRRIM